MGKEDDVCCDLKEFRSVVCLRLDAQEKSIAGLETRMTGIETRMTGIEAKMTGIEIKLAGLETRVGAFSKQLDKMFYMILAAIVATAAKYFMG
jgi:hypothetical protein